MIEYRCNECKEVADSSNLNCPKCGTFFEAIDVIPDYSNGGRITFDRLDHAQDFKELCGIDAFGVADES